MVMLPTVLRNATSVAAMLASLAQKYQGTVYHVDLRGTLKTQDDWANELHPTKDGFGQLADQINLALHQVLPAV